MRKVFLWVIIVGLGVVNNRAAPAQAPSAAVSKVFHEQRPLKFEPPLMDEVVSLSRAEWAARMREDPYQKRGDYFKIAWTSQIRGASHLKIVFEYRQKLLAEPQVIMVEAPGEAYGSHLTPIMIDGEAFTRGGPVTAWRVSIMDGGQVLATKQSFLW
jgi:hypothetical protein